MAAWTFGMFVWRELSTRNVEAALRFYGELAGWRSQKIDMPNGDYHLLFKGLKQVGGLLPLASGADITPYWMSYLSLPNIDGAVASARRLGGEVVWGPLNVENLGRMATIVDPRGGAFSIMKAKSGDPEYTLPQPGEFCWEQLASGDLPNARAFYAEVAGWKTYAQAGDLETFALGEGPGEQAATLVAAKPPFTPGWLSFIAVDAIGPACDLTVRLGGRLLSERVVLPGVGSYVIIEDPQGARLGLFK